MRIGYQKLEIGNWHFDNEERKLVCIARHLLFSAESQSQETFEGVALTIIELRLIDVRGATRKNQLARRIESHTSFSEPLKQAHSLPIMRANSTDLSLWQWLTESAGEAAITQTSQALQQGLNELTILTALRRSLGPEKASAALEQARLRRRAAEKFSHANAMLFTARALAQATGEIIADYKAARFGDHPACDLCCGIGGDLIALARRGAARGVDQDPIAAFCAAHNCRVNGGDANNVVCDRVENAKLDPQERIHLDPDRRPSSTRTVDLNFFEPGLSVIDQVRRQVPAAAIKLAPATRLPDEWYRDCQVEWIGHRGECKQQIVWSGDLALNPGRRAATVIANDGSSHDQLVEGPGRSAPPELKSLYTYLIEPHASVLAAELTWELAAEVNGFRFSPEIVYLTTDRPQQTLLASCFEILETVQLRPSAIEPILNARGQGVFEIKTRGLVGIDLSPFKQIKSDGPKSLTLVLTRVASQPRALICRRIVRE